MLTRITLTNFKTFKNTVSIDLTKTNYTFLPQNVADNNVLKGCIFVGPNACGKSSIILGMKLLLDFLFSERNLNSGIFLCLFGNSPCYSLAYEFLICEKTINYSFEVDTKKSMITEKLFIDNKLMLDRIGLCAKSYIVEQSGINYDETDVGKDTLFLRTLYFNTKFASNPILKTWMDFLKNSIYINMFEKTIKSYNNQDISMTKYLNTKGCQLINEFFNKYNFDQNIEYKQDSSINNLAFTSIAEDKIKDVYFKRKGINTPIPFAEESLGNQNLLRILPAFLSTLDNDGLLLIDEFSSGFHNKLESLLVQNFMETSRHSQLLFVSHSTNLLSNSILRPDQEYSVDFTAEYGSSVRRFSSEQPRSAQNIEKMYISGVFGGLPNYSKTK